MTVSELEALWRTLDDAVAALDFDAGCSESGGCRAAEAAICYSQALRPHRDLVREWYLDALRKEARGVT